MKAITLTQPWASLIAIGAKKIETRSWPTNFRGPIAIHAAKGFPSEAKSFCESKLVCRLFGWPECPTPLTQEWLDDNAKRIKSLPLGCVVATAHLVSCIDSRYVRRALHITAQEEALGNYDPGRYGFLLEDVYPLPNPIPAKGGLSLWQWDVDQFLVAKQEPEMGQ